MKNIITIKILLISYTILNIITFANGQTSKIELINEVVKKYKQHSSISYDINYSIKTFSSDETYKIKSKCKLFRNPKDSIFGGTIWYKVKDSLENYEKIYNIKSSLKIYNNKKEILRYDVHKRQVYQITGNFDGDVINTYFLKPDRLTEIISDTENVITIKDTSIYNITFLYLKIYFANDENFSNVVKTIFINKKTKIIEKIYYSANDKDQIQKNYWELYNVKFDDFDTSDLQNHINLCISKYKVTDFKATTNEELAPLKNDMAAPDCYGKIYPDLKQINVTQYQNKIVILDFWYMACSPCIKIIPILNNIYQKYKDDIIVLGLNPYDDDIKQINKIPIFIERNSLSYPIVFVNSSILKNFNIKAFPTLYIIDSNGLIKYSHVGYSENFEMELHKIINDMINK